MEGRNVNIGKTGIRTGEEENGEKKDGKDGRERPAGMKDRPRARFYTLAPVIPFSHSVLA